MRAHSLREGRPLSILRSECTALIRWAELAGKIISSGYIERFTYISEGAEHRVYHDPAGNQVFKTTLAGRFGHSVFTMGRSGTPLEYLSRLAWQNSLFGDKIQVVGVCSDGESYVAIVHSQPWITAHATEPAPLEDEIKQHFAELGFQCADDEFSPPIFYNQALDLVAADAHNANVIRNEQGQLVAIDVVIGTPGPQVRAEIRRRFDLNT